MPLIRPIRHNRGLGKVNDLLLIYLKIRAFYGIMSPGVSGFLEDMQAVLTIFVWGIALCF